MPPIGAIDDEVASVAQLVGQTLAGHPADDRRAALPLLRRRKNGQFTPLSAHGALQGSDDVAALVERSQGLLGVRLQDPDAGSLLLGQSETLQLLQPSDQQRPMPLEMRCLELLQAYLAILTTLAPQRAVQARPALLGHLSLKRLLDLPFRPQTQPFGGQLGRSVTEALGNVIAGDDEMATGIVAAAENEVRVVPRRPARAAGRLGCCARAAGTSRRIARRFGAPAAFPSDRRRKRGGSSGPSINASGEARHRRCGNG